MLTEIWIAIGAIQQEQRGKGKIQINFPSCLFEVIYFKYIEITKGGKPLNNPVKCPLYFAKKYIMRNCINYLVQRQKKENRLKVDFINF